MLDFVDRVTKEGSSDFIPAAERIAARSGLNKPVYFQVQLRSTVKALAPQHPEWRTQPPFKALFEGDRKAFAAGGEKALLDVIAVTHTGMTNDQFQGIVKDWIRTARHPRLNAIRRMYLSAHARIAGLSSCEWFQDVYRFRRQRRIHARVGRRSLWYPTGASGGSMGKQKFELRDGEPVLLKLPAVDFVDDHSGKPIGIQKFIGRRPILAFGNSEGDHQMLQWTAAGTGPRFMGLVHHTDAERE